MALEQAQTDMAKGARAERTTRGLYRSQLFAVLGHSVYRHWTQADAGF